MSTSCRTFLGKIFQLKAKSENENRNFRAPVKLIVLFWLVTL